MVSSLLSIAIRPNQAEVVMSSASPWLAWIKRLVAWVFAPEWLADAASYRNSLKPMEKHGD